MAIIQKPKIRKTPDKWWKKEENIASVMVNYFRDLGWGVYQEVSFGYGDKRPDIVAVNDNLGHIIEVKTSLTLDLLKQVYNHRNKAHYISIAIPHYQLNSRRFSNKSKDTFYFCRAVCEYFGIGIYLITDKDVGRFNPEVNLAPKLNRNNSFKYIQEHYLYEAQKTHSAAGNNTASFYSPFQQTVINIKDYLAKCPSGANIKDIMSNIRHHYASDSTAKHCIMKYINEGIIKGIGIRKGKQNIYYLEEGI